MAHNPSNVTTLQLAIGLIGIVMAHYGKFANVASSPLSDAA